MVGQHLYKMQAQQDGPDYDQQVATWSIPSVFTSMSLSALNVAPASAVDTGVLGEIRVTADFIYVATATDTWKRAALVTW